ncbi:MAG TPA: hypothetical protein VF610_11115 [Segetibacter sp.]|jgi:hypothetical protein
MVKKKRWSFFKNNKRLFLVSISENYWPAKFPEWNDLTYEQQFDLREDEYQKIDHHLTSQKSTLSIFIPVINGEPTLQIRIINAKKKAVIRYIYFPKPPA